MIIYSEKTKEKYESVEACEAAEAKFDKAKAKEEAKKKALADERASRAKEVEDAYKAIVDAQKHYNELKRKFLSDYNSFHMTFSSKNEGLDWVFDDFFKIF